MKQYVLDEPAAAVPAPTPVEMPAPSLTPPGWWRWLVLALLLEPVALALLYVALNDGPSASAAAPSGGVAYVAAFAFPREAEAAPAQPTEAPVSRIRQERGRYLVELHGESPAEALAMLAGATKSRVAGTGIFDGSALRLTRSVVATSPREAWQAVFGDVANFAIACAGSACEVRFVSLTQPGAPAPRVESPPREVAEFAPPAPEPAPATAPPPNSSMARAAAAPPLNENGEPTSSDN